jgi:drug/metabolite transporter (DMT)-like permease
LTGSLIALAGVTAGTLYQRQFSPKADLLAAAAVQFAVTAAVVAPLAMVFEGFQIRWAPELLVSIAFLVIFTSLLGVSALYYLLRHGEATRVTSMMYLPPVFAVVLEAAWFGLVPSALALGGIAVTCAGVAMTVWRPGWKSPISSR